MELIVFSLVAGYILGLYVKGKKMGRILADATHQAGIKIDEERRKIQLLEKTIEEQKQRVEQRSQYWRENDVSIPRNQKRFIKECNLKSIGPVNSEAVRILYIIEEWIKRFQPRWRVAFEVSMGSFIKTDYKPEDPLYKRAFNSYSGKRVDFLLIDRFGKPVLVVEYHGSGHYLSDDAEERMEVKRLVLQKVQIPLLEIPYSMEKPCIIEAISTSV